MSKVQFAVNVHAVSSQQDFTRLVRRADALGYDVFGAGYRKSEHEDAQLPWLPLEARVQALEDMVLEVRRRLAEEAHRPQPVPVMVGAMSSPALSVAARHAEVVGFAGLRQVKGAPAGTFTVCSAAEALSEVIAAPRATDAPQPRAGGPHGCLCTFSGAHIRSYGSLCTFPGADPGGISAVSG